MTTAIAREMVAAEILKLRRNRALMGFSAVLTMGIVVVVFVYTAVQHATGTGFNPPAGGMLDFSRAVRVLGLFFGPLAAVLIGTEAGTADLSSGVFRDLVATGRSRTALFAVRAPAAAIVTVAFYLAAFALTLAGTFVFSAGGSAEPSLTMILESIGWIALSGLVTSALAVGIGSLTGSRALTLTGLIGWLTVATQIIMNIPSLGSARDGLLMVSLGAIKPIPGGPDVAAGTAAAILVLAAWTVIPTALGAWRTRTMDA